MRAVYRTFPIVRSLATNVSAGAKPAAPIQDPLKNVVGKFFLRVYIFCTFFSKLIFKA